MAEKPITEQTRADKSALEARNEFSLVTDDQLLRLLQAIKNEVARRCTVHRSRKKFAAKLIANDEDVPEIFWKRGGKLKWDKETCRGLPYVALGKNMNVKLKYLKRLVAQDWSHLWQGFDAQPRYCVYAHVDPKSGSINMPQSLGDACHKPFYVGKGTLQRANDMNRNQGHGIKLKQVFSAGATRAEVVHIFADGMTEAESFELEAKLIYFFGTIYEKDRSGILLNLDVSLRPRFEGRMMDANKASSTKKSAKQEQPVLMA